MIEWFTKWNRENPVDVYRPAILYGAGGVAVIAAIPRLTATTRASAT